MEVPDLPSQVEEMLLSPYHVLLQTWRVGGGQTKYGGHTCLYAHDSGRFLSRLPLTITDLDVLIIKPANARIPAPAANPSEDFARRPEFQVQRSRILANLRALQHFHPAFQNIEIDWEALNSLPENGSVFHQLRSVDLEEVQYPAPEPDLGPGEQEGAAEQTSLPEIGIPNLGEGSNIVEDIRAALEQVVDGEPQAPLLLTGPVLHSTPINEHDVSNPFLTKAFPFLFPTGQGDLHQQRHTTVRDVDYIRHLLYYQDGRFAKHPRFR